ncbi:unnamed protein product [Gongylonema pulchrum]|uniref:G_PROTEIN_RECEP_F1_2 domain-containing protein n=1 Tax=Gongylonema pulchrum TaxID=637853 RepID=A0A183CZH4_9BILA|nr:unnamed protein product [Gongylonema pulchrum]
MPFEQNSMLTILLTIVVLVLLDPEYTVAYISVNYEIVLIYIISSLTLLYCVVSIIMYAVVQRRRSDTRAPSLTNCSITVSPLPISYSFIYMLFLHHCL